MGWEPLVAALVSDWWQPLVVAAVSGGSHDW